jgi:uncharacterized repeat protein (TIGR04076 family)
MPDRNKLKITVLRRLDPDELFETMPVAKRDWMVPCTIYEDGQEFVVEESLRMPEGFCESAWRAINHNVRALGYGGNFPFHDERSVSVSCCTDGLRPVIFKIERI